VVGVLVEQPFSLDLGPDVASAGFAVVDHAAVIDALAGLGFEGVPERAVPKRRAEFLAGRWAARQALAKLGVDATPSRNEDGSPRWPAQIIGSITHGAGRALCAVARVGRVRSLGIDAERLMTESTKRELLDRICSDEEQALLVSELSVPGHQAVSFAFSAKESLYKCLYPLMGHFMDFSAARVVGAMAHAGQQLTGALTLELSVDWSAKLRRGQRLRAEFVASDAHVESAVLLVS
jgi:4'-phosphopantetheinyl transferase EntD